MGPLSGPPSLTVAGVPRELDASLRLPARILLLALGALASGALAWAGAWWWMPLPLATSFLMFEWFFATRADQPIAVRLDRDEVAVSDTFLQLERRVPLGELAAATLAWRTLDRDRVEVMLVLADPREVVLGLHLRLASDGFQPEPDDVHVDAVNALVGSIGGLPRAMCPRDRLVRQHLDDPRVVAWFRTLPAAARRCRALRYWRGRAPPLDLFAYHTGAPDGLALLDPTSARLGAEPVPLEPGSPEASSRAIVAFRRAGDPEESSERTVPMWVQPVAGHRFAFPAPLAQGLPERAPDDALLHVHAADGGVLLWHLLRVTPPERWPDAWVEALTVARPTLERWPEWLVIPAREAPASVTVPPPPQTTP